MIVVSDKLERQAVFITHGAVSEVRLSRLHVQGGKAGVFWLALHFLFCS